jgi:hypothetical protein
MYNLLTGAPAIATTVQGRIHYDHLPQGSPLPAIVLQLISAEHGHTMRGPAPYATGIARINCLATTPGGASDLAQAVRQTINGFRGQAGPVSFAFIVVGDEQTIPHNVREGEAIPDVHGVLVDLRFMTKTTQED